MKICPKCQTKYDETIIRFCTKDGSPLVDENPIFTAMPSQSFSTDDIGEETMITRNRVVIPPLPPTDEEEEVSTRVVIPIGEERKQAVRPIENPQRQYQAPRKSNTALIVLLTVFGTVAILAGGVGVWWFLSSSSASVANTNSNGSNNQNLAVNYNSSSIPDANFNLNANVNSGTNVNANSNVNTNANSTPKPSPSKTPTPKPNSNTNANANVSPNSNTNTANVNSAPTNTNTEIRPPSATPTPTAATPKPSATPTKTPPSNVNIGIMNSRAKELRRPAYPSTAKQMGASGQVVVQVSIDEDGNVVSAKAVSGHILLRVPAEAAARQSSFNPVRVGDKNIKANGTIVYNFINQ